MEPSPQSKVAADLFVMELERQIMVRTSATYKNAKQPKPIKRTTGESNNG